MFGEFTLNTLFQPQSSIFWWGFFTIGWSCWTLMRLKKRKAFSAFNYMFMLLGCATGSILIAKKIVSNILHPREWDFICFRIYGELFAEGQNPYNVTALKNLAASYETSENFQHEIYCLYPPPCLWQFWPLGFGSVHVACACWNLLLLLALCGIVFEFWKMCDSQRTRLGLGLAAALVLGLHFTRETFEYAQSNTVLLCLVFLGNSLKRPIAQCLALGTISLFKPIGIIFLIPAMLRREWVKIFFSLLPLAVATFGFLLFRGFSGFQEYASRNPLADDIAIGYYTENVNQSLLAVFLRCGVLHTLSNPVMQLPFLIACAILTSVTCWAILRKTELCREMSVGIVVCLALLVYPGSLSHYALLLLFPLSVLIRHTRDLHYWPLLLPLMASLISLAGWLELAFIANFFMWGIMLFLITQTPESPVCKPAPTSVTL
jgi:Glycosyltransferase family 87